MTASTGIDRDTGLPLSDLDHVRQSFKVIITTHLGERVMRRNFGSAVPGVLGRNMVPRTFAVFFAALTLAIYLWEPRLRIVQMLYPAPPNAPQWLRLGGVAIAIIADYRPYALQGDVVTDVRRIYI